MLQAVSPEITAGQQGFLDSVTRFCHIKLFDCVEQLLLNHGDTM